MAEEKPRNSYSHAMMGLFARHEPVFKLYSFASAPTIDFPTTLSMYSTLIHEYVSTTVKPERQCEILSALNHISSLKIDWSSNNEEAKNVDMNNIVFSSQSAIDYEKDFNDALTANSMTRWKNLNSHMAQDSVRITAVSKPIDENVHANDNASTSIKSGFSTAKQQYALSSKKPLGSGQMAQSRLIGLKKLKTTTPSSISASSSSSVSTIQQPNSATHQQPTDSLPVDDRLAGLDPKLVERILNEVIENCSLVTWDDIAGLEHAKSTVMEMVVWPLLRPDIFTGLRGPPKGLLLFGPPGTGKTLIGKCIASQSKATFFNISASSLTSKWVGEGEKMVRALFALARVKQPSVIFIDEIDSLLTQRSESDYEASRRIKTEFLVQFDGAGTSRDDRILIIGATNRPQEIDEAARRRLVKRLYIPLPDSSARVAIIQHLLTSQTHSLTTSDFQWLSEATDGYSGADVDNLCREAALGPIRSIKDISKVSLTDVREISLEDFQNALTQVRPSVSLSDLKGYEQWNAQFGSLSA